MGNEYSQSRKTQVRKNKAPSHRKPKNKRDCVLMLGVRHRVSKAGNKEPGRAGKQKGSKN